MDAYGYNQGGGYSAMEARGDGDWSDKDANRGSDSSIEDDLPSSFNNIVASDQPADLMGIDDGVV